MNKIKSNINNFCDFASWREIATFFQESLELPNVIEKRPSKRLRARRSQRFDGDEGDDADAHQDRRHG